MTPAGTFYFIVLLTTLLFTYIVVRDIFSPDKLALIFIGIFFGDIFFNEYSVGVGLCFLLLIMVVLVVTLAIGTSFKSAQRPFTYIVKNRKTLCTRVPRVGQWFFWVISIPALLAQAWIVMHFGGIEGYINILAISVVEFASFGPILVIIKTFGIINLVYFSCLFTGGKYKTLGVKYYILHLLIFVLLALLTTSRGSLLTNFALMAMIYHHAVRPVKAKWLILLFVSLLLIASLLEVAREGVAFGEDGLVTGLSEQRQNDNNVSFGWARYGLIPLDLVLEAEDSNLHYGFTYLTLVTNLVPRSIWPGKPDSGGNILTIEYTGNSWNGFSFLSTGILPEAIINFGIPIGIIFGALQFFIIIKGLLFYYHRFKLRLFINDPYQFIDSVYFAYICWGLLALISGEFTNVMVNMLVQLTCVWIIKKMIEFFDSTAHAKNSIGNLRAY